MRSLLQLDVVQNALVVNANLLIVLITLNFGVSGMETLDLAGS